MAIKLESWSDFPGALRAELLKIGHTCLVLVRNFDLLTADLNESLEQTGETDRLQVVLNTGVDRDAASPFWNEEGHDYRHDQLPLGKKPHEIIYAYVVDASADPYLVHVYDSPEVFDLTQSLGEENGILIYDASKLTRMSKNEHWFQGDPRLALLAVFRLEQAA